jgi:hypothetical protein
MATEKWWVRKYATNRADGDKHSEQGFMTIMMIQSTHDVFGVLVR